MKVFLILTLSIFSLNIFADSALSERLRLNDSYNRIYEKVNSSEEDPALAEFASKAQEAYKAQKKLEDDPNYRAKLFYQDDVRAKPCAHCPQYLSLINEVNKIVEKVPTSDVKSNNEKMISLTKLKFLYYTVQSNTPEDQTSCKLVTSLLPNQVEEFKKGKMNLAAEQALQLPNVNSVQYYEGKGKDVHYFYRGESDSERNVVIEVIAKADGSAVIKYYKYDPNLGLPDLGGNSMAIEPKKKGDNYIDIDPSVETKKMVLVDDIKFGKIGNKINVTDDVNIKHETAVSFNKQQTSLSLEDEKGKQYVAVQGTNIVDGKKTIDAVVNYDFEVVKESDLKIGTSVGNKTEFGIGSSNSINTQTAKLSLSDKDNEYLNFKSSYDEKGMDTYGFGNKFKAGDGSVGSSADFDRQGNKTYSLKALDQGYISEAGVKYKYNYDGTKNYGAVIGTNLDSSTKLKTEYSRSSTGSNSYGVAFEKNISENTSMVLTIKNDSSSGTNVMYQFQSKF